MSVNYFQGTPDSPYHISIGAVVVNEKNKIACHYFKKIKDVHTGKQLNDFYILMRETIEPNETIEQALYRGIQEEFTMRAQMERYLGSFVSEYQVKGINIQKTTLYFLCKFIENSGEERKLDDPEKDSELQWRNIDFLIDKMKEQKLRLNRSDVDESQILIRAKKYL